MSLFTRSILMGFLLTHDLIVPRAIALDLTVLYELVVCTTIYTLAQTLEKACASGV